MWHDAAALRRLLASVDVRDAQWIMVNGDPADEEVRTLAAAHPGIEWMESPRGRGIQQNTGAESATGAWLLFVHADSELPDGWRNELRLVAGRDSARWGCFRFGLDATAWQARVIEWGVALRVRWWSLPYGDQGLFVRRDAFQSVGGFPPYPLMEDVALVGRLRRRFGPPFRSRLQVRTSARRWQRDGWWRRTAVNLSVLLRYLTGVAPERLVRPYDRRQG